MFCAKESRISIETGLIRIIISTYILIFYFSSRILWSQNGMQIYNDNCVDMFILRLCLLWSMIFILWQEDNNHIEWQVFSENVTIWNLPLLFNFEHVWCLTFFTKQETSNNQCFQGIRHLWKMTKDV